MKLVFLCDEYPPASAGGIGVVLRGLAEGLARERAEVHVVGAYALTAAVHETLGGVQVHRLPRSSGHIGMVANRVRLLRALSAIARSGPIDVLEAPDFEGPGAFLPRISRTRVVRLHGTHTYFSDERGRKPSRIISMLERKALAQADAWISCSDYTARRTASVFALDKPSLTIHNAASVPPRAPRKTDYLERKRAVYFGTLTEKKGVLSLAAAWREFVKHEPDWRLEIIGRDTVEHGTRVSDMMRSILGPATGTVAFTGAVENAALLARLPEFDFAILPSFSEAFALAPMEAMALGVPVIFTKLSSGPELIAHGQDGWLADPGRPAELAALMNEVAVRPELRLRVAQAGRAKMESGFSHSAFVARNLSVYRDLLSHAR
jgi:glycosyltransferase involved in cell wall biosynthesis